MKAVRFFLFLFFAGTIFTDAFAQSGMKSAEPPPTASVSGRVTLDGEPAAGVRVRVRAVPAEPHDAREIAEGQTGPDGTFRIDRLPAGRLVVDADRGAAMALPVVEYGSFSGNFFDLEAGESVENILIAFQTGGVITGRVTDTAGRPVIGVRLVIQKERPIGNEEVSWGGGGEGFTDDRGIYRIFGLAPGRYRVVAGDGGSDGPESRTATSYYLGRKYGEAFAPGTTDPEKAAIIVVAAGKVAENIDIVLGPAPPPPPRFIVKGRVVDTETGKPISNVWVQARWGETVGPQDAAAFSDTAGAFTLSATRTGTCHLSAMGLNPDGTHPPLLSEPATVEFTEKPQKDFVVRIRHGRTITGRVESTLPQSGTTLPGITFHLTRNEPGTTVDYLGITQADGSFQMPEIAPGNYVFFISFGENGKAVELLTVRQGNAELPDRKITIGDGPVNDVVLRVRPIISVVRGELRIPEALRADLSDVQVWLFPTTPPPADSGFVYSQVPMDDRGRFTIQQVRPGSYQVKVNLRLKGERAEAVLSENLVDVPEQGEVTVNPTVLSIRRAR